MSFSVKNLAEPQQNHPLQFSHPWQHARPDPPLSQTPLSTTAAATTTTASKPRSNPIRPRPISLRPLGRTGSGPSLVPSPLTLPKLDKEFLPPPSPKTDRFVPPHLRPGFAGREEKPEPVQGVRSRNFGSYGEDGRPKSGGGYERIRVVGDSYLVEVTRPGSGGTRPNSSG
ncbi:hypothetical protein Acr_00g0097190 [Actinidia rufa]|uniref:Uncharacterized protein n=1 Tax=Actinidia rufa TaxID=165716 RepID=A0A7J0DYX0_9ERIC|nr:hypothetical protein Acr_00g0097190 [Actinidia rufa]